MIALRSGARRITLSGATSIPSSSKGGRRAFSASCDRDFRATGTPDCMAIMKLPGNLDSGMRAMIAATVRPTLALFWETRVHRRVLGVSMPGKHLRHNTLSCLLAEKARHRADNRDRTLHGDCVRTALRLPKAPDGGRPDAPPSTRGTNAPTPETGGTR